MLIQLYQYQIVKLHVKDLITSTKGEFEKLKKIVPTVCYLYKINSKYKGAAQLKARG